MSKVSAVHARFWIFAAIAAAGGIGVGMTMAAIPAPDGTIRACYNKKNGRLRVVDEGASCKGKEIVMTWAQAGTPGPTGPSGAGGTPGEPATRLWAVVDSLGLLKRGSGVIVPVGTDLSVAGNRRDVPFDRDIRECAVVATIAGASLNGGVSAGFITASIVGNGQTVRVTMQDETASSIENQSFHLAVFC